MADDPLIRIAVPGIPKQTARARSRLIKPKSGPGFISTYTPPETRSEMAVIRDFAEQAMMGRVPLDGPIDLRVSAYFPVPASWSQKKQQAALDDGIRPTKKPDWDNVGKLAGDCLSGLCFRDDSQITDAAVYKRYSSTPRLIIEVRRANIKSMGHAGGVR